MDGIWAFDGSDYDISLNSCNSVAEEDSEDDIGSINSTNYHNEIDGVFPPERILQHCESPRLYRIIVHNKAGDLDTHLNLVCLYTTCTNDSCYHLSL